MLARVTAAELTEWLAYYALEAEDAEKARKAAEDEAAASK